GAPDADAVAETLAAMEDLTPASDPVDISFPEPTVERAGGSEEGDGEEGGDGEVIAVDGEVLAIDRFGNVITNVPGELVRGRDWVRVDGDLTPVAETFGAVDPGERLVTVGSHGYAECDVNDGRGDGAFDLRPGDSVRFVPDSVSL
ncbi:S-adenosyl-l-methionine hydroxide adenosyltransferase, partial [Halorubrum sp. C3]